MAHIKNLVGVLAALCILAETITQGSQDATQTYQEIPPIFEGRVRRNTEGSYHFDISKVSSANWTTCDFTIYPKRRCHDCHTRLICKRVGGLLLNCPSRYAPYCNDAVCSPIPPAGCA